MPQSLVAGRSAVTATSSKQAVRRIVSPKALLPLHFFVEAIDFAVEPGDLSSKLIYGGGLADPGKASGNGMPIV